MDYPTDFLNPSNRAGQTLLRIVSRAHAIIAEMLRLADNIPVVFSGADEHESRKYAHILFGFDYLKDQDRYDRRIEGNEQMYERDEELRENHIEILQRFYLLFESIVRYHENFTQYIQNVREGQYLQVDLEILLNDVDGCQLLCEAIYLFGVILIIMDLRLPGPIREKLIIAFYRYQGTHVEQSIRDVVRLCRDTGYTPVTRPKGYPEDYFARFRIERTLIDMVVGRLLGHDIYKQSAAYPLPKHRTTMLANQASMLYVILYFAPQILSKDDSRMRGIVDRHFSDNWVVPVYMGILVDLNTWWDRYPSAKMALQNTMAQANVLEIIRMYESQIQPCIADLDQFLTEGVLTEDYVMDNIREVLLPSLRDVNTTLRWIMLHRKMAPVIEKKKKKKKNQVNVLAKIKETFPQPLILMILMKTAQFEFLLKNILQDLLSQKADFWGESKRECQNRLIELSEYFSGDKPLTRVVKNEQLQAWFKRLADQVASLDINGNPTQQGHLIKSLLSALNNVQDFHQIDTSLQIKAFLHDTKNYLIRMVRIVNVQENVVATVDTVSEFSYAWEVMAEYIELMQKNIKDDPSSVLFLRATFLKMESILLANLSRIQASGTADLESVSEFYSERLLQFVRTVLEVIPRTMFDMLQEIAVIRQQHLPKIDMKVERGKLKQIACPDVRFKLAHITHKISVFSEGLLNMHTTRFGVIPVEPQQLLEDGIRKELVYRISNLLNDHLRFGEDVRREKPKSRGFFGRSNSSRNELENSLGRDKSFEKALSKVGRHLESFQRSFEYIQDYIKVYGLKVWCEEFSRLMHYYIEQESNRFLRRKVYDHQSMYQSDAIPIPRFRGDARANNFTGRVVNELLTRTDPHATIYVDGLQSWLTPREMRHVVVIRTFNLLLHALGPVGLNGIDQMFGFLIVEQLQGFISLYNKMMTTNMMSSLQRKRAQLDSSATLVKRPRNMYRDLVRQCSQIVRGSFTALYSIGQKQLIRRQMKSAVSFRARMESKLLTCALEAMNNALLADVKAHYRRPDQVNYPNPDDGNELMYDVSEYENFIGMTDCISNIYVTTTPLEMMPFLLFLFVIEELEHLEWHPKLNILAHIGKKKIMDGTSLIVGVVTLLKQFHPIASNDFLGYMAQYVRSIFLGANQAASGSQQSSSRSRGNSTTNAEVPVDAFKALKFLEGMAMVSNAFDRKQIQAFIPPYLIDNFPELVPTA